MPSDFFVGHDGNTKSYRSEQPSRPRAADFLLDPHQHTQLGSHRLYSGAVYKLRLQLHHHHAVARPYHCFAFDNSARLLTLSHRAEVLVASTHQIAEIVKGQEGDFRRLDSLRSIHIGGSVAYAPLIARIRMLVSNLLYCGYGSTEGGTVAYTPSELVYGMDRAVGVTAPWIEIEVVDDQKKPLEYRPGRGSAACARTGTPIRQIRVGILSGRG